MLLGARWAPATLPLQALTLVMPLRMLSNIGTPMMLGIGRPDVNLTNMIMSAITMPLSFLVGSHWGLTGIIAAWLTAYPRLFVAMSIRTSRPVSLEYPRYLAALRGPLLCSLVMYAAVLAARKVGLVLDLKPITLLVVLVASGAATYTAVVWMTCPNRVREVLTLVRS